MYLKTFQFFCSSCVQGTGSESIQFLKHIRNYNNSLAMASTTAQIRVAEDLNASKYMAKYTIVLERFVHWLETLLSVLRC
uniref:Secreted protein n=1 Tax=Heligmosomoides polygyrus TaxID=6339 RepID=A0A183GEI4_HELPZ